MIDTVQVFAERMRNAREKRKMSQGDLAKKAGLQASAISHFETANRKPSFDNLRKIGEALNVTTDYLLGRSEDFQAHGEKIGAIARHVEKISSEDIDLAESFLKTLADRNKNK